MAIYYARLSFGLLLVNDEVGNVRVARLDFSHDLSSCGRYCL